MSLASFMALVRALEADWEAEPLLLGVHLPTMMQGGTQVCCEPTRGLPIRVYTPESAIAADPVPLGRSGSAAV